MQKTQNRSAHSTAALTVPLRSHEDLSALIVLLIFVALATIVWAQPEAEAARLKPAFRESRQIERTVSVERHDTVAIQHQFGNVQVNCWPEAKVRVSGELVAGGDSKACAESCLNLMTVRIEPQGRRLDISAVPDKAECSATQYQSDLAVTVPEDAVLTIDNSYGDLTVVDLQGMVTTSNRFGNSDVHRCWSADITNAFGDVNVDQFAHGITVRNRFGNVSARNLAGPIQISNENGTVRVIRGTGRAQLANTLGEMSLVGLQGRIQITNVHGPVIFRQLKPGPDTVTINNRDGEIHLKLPEDASALVNVRTSDGRVENQHPGARKRSSDERSGQSVSYELGSKLAQFNLETTGGKVVLGAEP
jgi:hypothetical protein